MSTLSSKAFWSGAGERAVKAVAQSLLAVIGVGGLGILDVDWEGALSVAVLAGVASVLTSITTADHVAATDVVATRDKDGSIIAGPASHFDDGTILS